MKTQYSATELAGMRLDGFPASEMGIRQRAARAGWTYTEIPCKGGNNGKKREYPPNPTRARAPDPVDPDQGGR